MAKRGNREQVMEKMNENKIETASIFLLFKKSVFEITALTIPFCFLPIFSIKIYTLIKDCLLSLGHVINPDHQFHLNLDRIDF